MRLFSKPNVRSQSDTSIMILLVFLMAKDTSHVGFTSGPERDSIVL